MPCTLYFIHMEYVRPLVSPKEESPPQLKEGFLEDAEKHVVRDDRYKIEAPQEAKDLCQALADRGGRALLVGGSVRDTVINVEHSYELDSKDWDFEVYGMNFKELGVFLKAQYGDLHVHEEGESFRVYKVRGPWSKQQIDFSVPREDSKVGEGSLGFVVKECPEYSIKEAAHRRDITANTLAYDLLTDKLYDAYGGIENIKKKEIVVTDEAAFAEDPLRVLRVMQFIARFEFKAVPKTVDLCRRLVAEGELHPISPTNKEDKPRPGTGAKGVSSDRITVEFTKLLTKGRKPSLGLEFAREIGFFDDYTREEDPAFIRWKPLCYLARIPQEEKLDWHPEGNVWEHTIQSMDAMVEIMNREFAMGRLPPQHEIDKVEAAFKTNRQLAVNAEKLDEEMAASLLGEKAKDHASMVERIKLTLMFGALCHDFGKITTTTYMEKKGIWAWCSHGHADVGISITHDFISKFDSLPNIGSAVELFVQHHMDPKMFWKLAGSPGKEEEERDSVHTIIDEENGDKPEEKPIDCAKALVKRARVFAGTTGSLYMLALVAEADQRGRRPKKQGKHPLSEDEVEDLAAWKTWYLEKIKDLNIMDTGVEYAVSGEDLLKEFSVKGGVWVKVVLECLLADQTEGIVTPQTSIEVWKPLAERYKEAAEIWVEKALVDGSALVYKKAQLAETFARRVSTSVYSEISTRKVRGLLPASWEADVEERSRETQRLEEKFKESWALKDAQTLADLAAGLKVYYSSDATPKAKEKAISALRQVAWEMLSHTIAVSDDARKVLFP